MPAFVEMLWHDAGAGHPDFVDQCCRGVLGNHEPDSSPASREIGGDPGLIVAARKEPIRSTFTDAGRGREAH